MDRLTYILDISLSPASGDKSMPIGLVTAVSAMATEDPQCDVVAQASFWRQAVGLPGGA